MTKNKSKKRRNPFAALLWLPFFKHKTVKNKKGKGSYTRKGKNKYT